MTSARRGSGLRWIADAYDGFTLTLCEGLTPAELLRLIGAHEDRIVPLTGCAAEGLQLREAGEAISGVDYLDWEDEELLAALTHGGFLPDPPGAIVRAGAVDGWAYALEEYSFFTTAHLTALSERGRAFFVHSNAKHCLFSYALRGEMVTSFVPGLPALVNGVPAEQALGFTLSAGESDEVMFLRFLETETGIYLPWEETEAALPAAAFSPWYPRPVNPPPRR